MLLELKNILPSLQTAIDVILASERCQFERVYLDYFVIFSNSPQKRIEQVRRVVRMLYEAWVTLKQKMSKFCAKTIDYLGNVIRTGLMTIAKHTTDAVAKVVHPAT